MFRIPNKGNFIPKRLYCGFLLALFVWPCAIAQQASDETKVAFVLSLLAFN